MFFPKSKFMRTKVGLQCSAPHPGLNLMPMGRTALRPYFIGFVAFSENISGTIFHMIMEIRGQNTWNYCSIRYV
jgi:hypothetical protein